MRHIDAEFKLFENMKVALGKPMLGYVFKDSKGRFLDGANVYTSPVKSIDTDNTDGSLIVTTLNTVYKIV